AGGLMTTAVVSVHRDQTVAGAIAAVRAAVAEDDPVDMVYVTEGEGRLVGHITLPALIAAPEDMPAGMVMDDETLAVEVTDADEDVARTLVHYNLTTVPVVDARGKLLGVVGIDDVIDLF